MCNFPDSIYYRNPFDMRRNPFAILFVLIVSFVACNSHNPQKEKADNLNELAYTARYKNYDSTRIYSVQAYSVAKQADYKEGMAEALLNKAFCSIAMMKYAEADTLLDKADSLSSNDVTRLIVEVQRMRLCQRRSRNKDFYAHKFIADGYIDDIHSDIENLPLRERKMYTYARSEYGIVYATYLYYVDRTKESSEALLSVAKDKDIILISDTAQYLGYLYNMGAGGMIWNGSAREISHTEFECLMQCYMMAKHNGYLYWEANALQALSEHIATRADLYEFKLEDDACLRYLNDDYVNDTLLSGNLAERSLNEFVRYGDVYQIAGGWRTLSQCYQRIGDHEAELQCLLNAVSDSCITQSPDLVAGISEKLSMAYSAFGDKQTSDIYRNQYLDMQDSTRQDRSLEARKEVLDSLVTRTEWLIGAIVVFLLILVAVVTFLIHYRRKYRERLNQNDRIEQLDENIQALTLQSEDAVRINVEQHAKVTYAENILPLIDRMLHSVENVEKSGKENLEYVSDICSSILAYNAKLTSWVQLRKGQVALHVESFPLQSLFSIIKMSVKSFSSKGIQLSVKETDLTVKADKVLTLFLINTIVDNARKYTPAGGEVSVCADKSMEFDGYAEIAISDSGEGMEQDLADHLFDYKTIVDQQEDLTVQKSHGFGLMNCRGIMDRYRKTSELFSHCDIKAESEKGKGTRIFFRLPIAVRSLLILLALTVSSSVFAANNNKIANSLADSVWSANVAARYADAVRFADSCLCVVNNQYRTLKGVDKNDTLTMDYNGAEIRWQEKKLPLDFKLIDFIRNEVAVSALALNDWNLYKANNNAYTKLYKACSQDSTLSTDCLTLERTETANNIAVCVLILLFVAIMVTFYWFYIRDVLQHRRNVENTCREKEETIERMKRERDRLYVSNNVIDNTLSALKHETMYYPSRIAQDNNVLLLQGETQDVSVEELRETIGYYRSLYSMLCSQCDRNSSEIKYQVAAFPLKSLKLFFSEDMQNVDIIANKQLIDYMVLLLKRKNGREMPYAEIMSVREIKASGYLRKYVSLSIECQNIRMTTAVANELFALETNDVDYLLMRQILRETGASSNAFAVGIRAEVLKNGLTRFVVVLPVSNKA